MVSAAVRILDDDEIVLKKAGVRFPVELRPAGFDPQDPSTWPEVVGRLELVEGRLLYMPPCADLQQDVAADLVHVLRSWVEDHAGWVVGGNEAGMKLGADIRAADAALWRRDAVGPSAGRLRQVPPVLAVEVAGLDDDEAALRGKARWYLDHGVRVVWILLPATREALVVEPGRETRLGREQSIPAHEALPDLAPPVRKFFVQIDR